MKIERLSRLFESISGVINENSENVKVAEKAAEEAVKVSTTSIGTDYDAAERVGKVEAIKQQVRDGSYKPDLNQVAGAVYRELFA